MDAAKICKADTKLESDVYCFVQHSYTPLSQTAPKLSKTAHQEKSC
ncbi:MAG: hypothetical protein KatS3mg130_2107 [Candidatus Sumerlaea sp.]|nr:MAG: hypothetical protein KatS3mg130_2107 [Candidatus Sumerlaea sp.]